MCLKPRVQMSSYGLKGYSRIFDMKVLLQQESTRHSIKCFSYVFASVLCDFRFCSSNKMQLNPFVSEFDDKKCVLYRAVQMFYIV